MSSKKQSRKATLPPLDHISYEDYEHVYEPSEDTFLLCDALLAEQAFLRSIRPIVAVEVGPGSGTVCTYLTALLTGHSGDSQGVGMPLLTLAVDVNPRACEVTLRTAAAASARVSVPLPGTSPTPMRVEAVVGDLLLPLLPRLQNCVDVLLFNPPYVCTPAEEVPSVSLGRGGLGAGIEAAWAGGPEGRLVTDRLLALLPSLLARPHGVAYILLLQENDPAAVAAHLSSLPFPASAPDSTRTPSPPAPTRLQGAIIASTRARNELLHVMKVSWVQDT